MFIEFNGPFDGQQIMEFCFLRQLHTQFDTLILNLFFFFKKRSLLCIFKTIFSNMGPTTNISTILPGAFLSFKTSSKRYTKNKKQTKQRLYVMHYIKYTFTTEALV